MKGVKPIKEPIDFQKYIGSGTGYILITDGGGEPNKIHFIELECASLTKDDFEEKVKSNAERHGKYFYSERMKSLVECAKKEMPNTSVRLCIAGLEVRQNCPLIM